ncbi:MAG: hypothetical protein HC848_08700 [Limnobacter sp.]|nr:hypothetical protein [Limnobacter sp.]
MTRAVQLSGQVPPATREQIALAINELLKEGKKFYRAQQLVAADLPAEGQELLGRTVPEDMRVRFAAGLDNPAPPQKGLAQVTAPDGSRWALFILRPLRPVDSPDNVDAPGTDRQNRNHPDDVRLAIGSPPITGFIVATLASVFFAAILAHTYSKPF